VSQNKMEVSTVQPIFNKFIENYKELEKINKDINNYKKQFKKRLLELKNENIESEKILLKYLEENNLPGIRSGDFLILADEKPISNNKVLRQKQVQIILENHQIDTSSKIYQDLVEAINTPKIYEKTEKKLKFKKYQNNDSFLKE